MSDFNKWLEANQDELVNLLRNDQEEALFRAWLNGYEHGLGYMGKFAEELWRME